MSGWKTHLSFFRWSSLAIATIFLTAGTSKANAQASEPIGTIVRAEALTKDADCKKGVGNDCAFVVSEAAKCTKLVNADCPLFDGDVLIAKGVRLEYRLCDGPVRRVSFTNGLIQYKITGTCPDAVHESLSVLYDLEVEAAYDRVME